MTERWQRAPVNGSELRRVLGVDVAARQAERRRIEAEVIRPLRAEVERLRRELAAAHEALDRWSVAAVVGAGWTGTVALCSLVVVVCLVWFV